MNIQSLRNKTLELEVALKTLNTDYQIICLSETWLKQEEVQFIKLEGSCNGSFDIFLEVFERLGREVSARFINYKTIWAGDFNINLAPSGHLEDNYRIYKIFTSFEPENIYVVNHVNITHYRLVYIPQVYLQNVKANEAWSKFSVKHMGNPSDPGSDQDVEEELIVQAEEKQVTEEQPKDNVDKRREQVVAGPSTESNSSNSEKKINYCFGKDRTKWAKVCYPRNVRTQKQNIITHLPGVKRVACDAKTPVECFDLLFDN
nr:unnamed protein product [Callosobruchus analis]